MGDADRHLQRAAARRRHRSPACSSSPSSSPRRWRNSQARADLQALADEQTALRRIAELTAQEAPADAVLDAVAVQASRLAGVEFGMVLRFEPDGSTEIVASTALPRTSRSGCASPAAATAPSSVSGERAAPRASTTWPRCQAMAPMAHQLGFSTSAAVPILAPGTAVGRAHRRRPRRADAAGDRDASDATSPSWRAPRSRRRRRAQSCACSPTSRPRCAASPSS